MFFKSKPLSLSFPIKYCKLNISINIRKKSRLNIRFHDTILVFDWKY